MFFKAIVSFVILVPRPRVGLRLPLNFPSSTSQVDIREEAPIGRYPFIVSLQFFSEHFCAGSILNENWILTAGHCADAVPSASLITVKAGKHDLARSEITEQSVKVLRSIIHENYTGGVGPYDIALLQLASPLKLNYLVQPIELAPPESEPTGEAWFCGWGATSPTRPPKVLNKLQHVKLEYIDRTTCSDAVRRLTGSSPVHETNVCTGPLTDGISACSGDSGGPLMSRNGGRVIQTGIASWAIIPCGTRGAPSIYTRVSKFNNWIAEKTGNYKWQF